jgi:predicted outer membrane lipoprotein
MYPIFQENRVAGRESFPFGWILGENLLYVVNWGLAAYLLWPVWRLSAFPVLTALWLVLLIVFQVLLKKHICTGCYYYGKWCHVGCGKLSAALFKPDIGNFQLRL